MTAYEANRTAGSYADYEPQPRRTGSSLMGKMVAVAGVLVSLLYLSNLGVGFFEFLPDNIPVVGNLDEAFFTVVLVASLRKLGIDFLPHLKAKKPLASES